MSAGLAFFARGAMLAGLAITSLSAAVDPLEGLVRDSPFLPVAGAAASAAETGPLEFRGVVFEGGAYTFSIYDQGAKEGFWARLGEKGLPFVVQSFNRENDSLVVEQQGRTLTLSLQAAKIANAPVAPAQPGPAPLPTTAGAPTPTPANQGGPQVVPGPPSGGPVPVNMNSDEAQRLQKMADEIRRRRALRQATPEPTPNRP